MNRRSILHIVASLCVAGSMPAGAQGFPDKPVRVIVPFAPGGSTDIVARITAQKLSERLKTQVIIENRGGGGGNIGSDLVGKAPPHGHTLLIRAVGRPAIQSRPLQRLPDHS